ncbi:MAG: hypothetical protein KBS81_02190 [Spirochaetales bacterium]|nr:hypothetical protein [Candidatus Physcosoma equi]
MEEKKRKELYKRILMNLISNCICGLSVGFFRQAAFGVDPFQCFCGGLANIIPISFGTLYVIINGVLLLFMLLLARSYIGIGTFINMFLLGYIIDFSDKMILSLFGAPGLGLRVFYLLFAVVILSFGSAFIFTADLGVSTYDWIALLAAKKQSRVPFRSIRIFTDCLCCAIGFVLGAIPGIGTIITAFFMGPLVSFFRTHFSEPFLYGRKAA